MSVGTRALLLDVMGTLVLDPFHECVPAFFNMSLDRLVREKHPTAWVEFELGRMDEAAFLPRFFNDGRVYDTDGLKRTMKSNYAWLPGMEKLIEDLHEKRIAMHVLSNYTCWYRMIEERIGLSRYVAWSFVSCETGVRKPDREAYLGAARALGLCPSDCLFVDDRERNCEAAEAVGMPAIVFESAEKLRMDLVGRGMI